MAKYSSSWTSISMAATANGLLTTNAYVALRGGTTTMQCKLSEVYMGGEAASASAVSIMILDRSSTASTGALSITNGSTVLTDATSAGVATPASFGSTAATTQATRSSANHILDLSFNAYGGIVRWVASPDQTVTILGSATANLSEFNLSAFTGSTTAAVSGHFLYEVV